MRTVLSTLAAVVALAVAADAAPVPKKKTEADKIVGTWKMTKRGGQPFAVVAEFTADGKFTLKYLEKEDGPEQYKETGKYKVVDGKLEYTLAREGGPERSAADTIKKLTDDELILVDPDDVAEEYTKVKEEKKKEEKKDK